MRRSLVVIVALEALAAVQIAYYFPRLPATVASHFNAAGMPNSWESKQMFLELYVVVLVSIAVVYFVLPRLLFAVPPAMINLPNRNYWLDPRRRTEALERFADHFAILGAGTVALLIAVFQLVIQANLSTTKVFSSSLCVVLLCLYVVFVGVWFVLMFASFRRPRSG